MIGDSIVRNTFITLGSVFSIACCAAASSYVINASFAAYSFATNGGIKSNDISLNNELKESFSTSPL